MNFYNEINELIESYQRRRESIKGLIGEQDEASPDLNYNTTRLLTKLGVYRTIITELQGVLKYAEPVAQVGNRPVYLPEADATADMLDFYDWSTRNTAFDPHLNKWINRKAIIIGVKPNRTSEIELKLETLQDVYRFWLKNIKVTVNQDI